MLLYLYHTKSRLKAPTGRLVGVICKLQAVDAHCIVFSMNIVRNDVCRRLHVLRGKHRHPAPGECCLLLCPAAPLVLCRAADNISPVSMSARCIQTLPSTTNHYCSVQTVNRGGGAGFVQSSFKVTPPPWCPGAASLLPSPCCSSQAHLLTPRLLRPECRRFIDIFGGSLDIFILFAIRSSW